MNNMWNEYITMLIGHVYQGPNWRDQVSEKLIKAEFCGAKALVLKGP